MFLRCQCWAGRSPTADLSGGQLIAATQDALEEESFALPDATANLGAMKSPDTEQLLAEGIESNPAWAGLTAVKEGRYILLPKELFHNKPNHRWGASYEILADYLYPEEAA